MRSLELIILQFFVVVIMPNNAVGTPDLPAVGAKKVAAATGSRPVVPWKTKRAVAALRSRQGRPQTIGSRQPPLRQADLPRAAALQLLRPLQI